MLFLLLLPLLAIGQSVPTLQESMMNQALNPKTIRGISWVPGTDNFTYYSDDGALLLQQSINSPDVDTLLKAESLLPELKRFPAITWLNSAQFYFIQKNHLHVYDLPKAELVNKSWIDEEADHVDIEPKTLQIAFTKGNNLLITHNSETKSVSNDANTGIVYGFPAHRNEFGISKGTFWSPSGSKLAFYRMDEQMVTNYPLTKLENRPLNVTEIRYPMAGNKSHHATVGIFNPKNNQTIYLNTGEPKEQYLTNIAWSPDEKHILIAIVNREQNEMKLNRYNAENGSFVNTIFIETDAEWIEPENPPVFLPGNNNEFIWQSERDGFMHLYLCDVSGKKSVQLTKGNFVITDFHGFDSSGKVVFATIADNFGLDRKLIRCDLKGKTSILTPLSGTHSCLFNDSKTAFIDRFSNLQTPGQIDLFAVNGKLIRTLHKAANPLENTPYPSPELLQLKALDGTLLNARMFKPANIPPGAQLPVVIYVYGGPHAQMVANRWMGGGNIWMSWMAAQGYVVFTLDNRGSAYRGTDFEQVIHRRLGDAETSDQMQGVNYLKSLPFVNPTAIGVHGWSYGGFMTSTLMARNPGVFKAGVAGGPVIDWALYEIMYTERYMYTPEENPEGYKKASLLQQADSLRDRLMLIHGTIDDVVVWQHSQEMVKTCVDKGILIDYMIYPEHPHNVGGKDRIHLYRTISRYLMEHLSGKAPGI